MKNITKRFFFYLLLLSQLIAKAGSVDPCPLAVLVSDLSISSTEFKVLVKESNGFNAWFLLNNEAPALRTNIEELKLVSKNLVEINGVGGYDKWKKIQSYGKEIADILIKKTKIDDLTNAPAGYEVYTAKNSKYIRRLDVSNTSYPRLAVDENGIIIIYNGSTRLSSSSKFVRNLETVYGKMPLNHQRHHLVPDNVVKNSAIHIEAMSRGLYDVDRAGNGRYLAEHPEFFTEASKEFPTHFGSHPNYDIAIKAEIESILISNKVNPNDVSKLTDTQIKNILEDIEDRALDILDNWKPSSLN